MKNFKILNFKYLISLSSVALFLIVCWALVGILEIKLPKIYLFSEVSKTIQALPGTYCWNNWRGGVCVDSIHPTEFQYTPDNTLNIGKNEQIILSNKKIKIDRRHPFELSNLECFDKNKEIIDYKVSPIYNNGDLYINAPSTEGVYICYAVLKYKQGAVSYVYKLVVVNDENKINY